MDLDPFKSCFFLIFSIFFGVIYFSNFNFIWFSYFISLLFLRGIFVILIYVSSLSKLEYYFFKGGSIIFILAFLMGFFNFQHIYSLGLNKFFSFLVFFYILILFLIIYFLLVFIGFYINFVGSFRKFRLFFYFLDLGFCFLNLNVLFLYWLC